MLRAGQVSTVGKEGVMPRVIRDGVGLAYERTGSGTPTLLLIHGAFADRSAYSEQVAYFSGRHDIVCVDLRGHGESDAPEGPYTVQGFADDVAFVAHELGLRKCVVVGHSLGGLVSVELAGRHPDVVASVATLDSPSLIPGWSRRFTHPLDGEMESAQFRSILRGFLSSAYHPADDQVRLGRSLDAIDRMPDHAVRATWGALEWEPEAALRACKVPFLYLDHYQPGYDLTELRALCPQVASGQTVGAGHWALKDVPGQVNAMLERFIDNAEVLAEYERTRTVR